MSQLTSRLSPEEIDSPYSYTGKRDVWYAGLVLLQLLFGRKCLWIYPNLQTLLAHGEGDSKRLTDSLAPGGVSSSMVELLTGLLNPSQKKRLTADDALVKLRSPEEETTRRPGRPIPCKLKYLGPELTSQSVIRATTITTVLQRRSRVSLTCLEGRPFLAGALRNTSPQHRQVLTPRATDRTLRKLSFWARADSARSSRLATNLTGAHMRSVS